MIIPIVGESEWMPRLADLPRWEPPLRHALVVAPHPDDETLGTGGLIAALRSRGIEVTVVAVTDGENAYPDDVEPDDVEPDDVGPDDADTYDGELSHADLKAADLEDSTPGLSDLAKVREREQTKALARLGVDRQHIIRLRLPDGGLGGYEDVLTEHLLRLVSEEMQLVAPWQKDFHPDHEVCGRAARAAADSGKIPLTSYFFWTWHRGMTELLEGLKIVAFPLTDDQLRAKLEALSCHRSQLEHPSGFPILPEYLLGPAHRHFEVYLPA
jgi:LmbE family N-acetylglucosaminyl deacetylase